jgi:hypothetical protein
MAVGQQCGPEAACGEIHVPSGEHDLAAIARIVGVSRASD